MDFLSDNLNVRFDSKSRAVLVSNPNIQQPLVTVREETYSEMSFDEAASFLGARLLLLMPEMRKHFSEDIERMASSENGLGFKNDR